MKLKINGVEKTLDVDPEMPLLWALRDVLGPKVPALAGKSAN